MFEKYRHVHIVAVMRRQDEQIFILLMNFGIPTRQIWIFNFYRRIVVKKKNQFVL